MSIMRVIEQCDMNHRMQRRANLTTFFLKQKPTSNSKQEMFNSLNCNKLVQDLFICSLFNNAFSVT
jgi:hypothetical protein